MPAVFWLWIRIQIGQRIRIANPDPSRPKLSKNYSLCERVRYPGTQKDFPIRLPYLYVTRSITVEFETLWLPLSLIGSRCFLVQKIISWSCKKFPIRIPMFAYLQREKRQKILRKIYDPQITPSPPPHPLTEIIKIEPQMSKPYRQRSGLCTVYIHIVKRGQGSVRCFPQRNCIFMRKKFTSFACKFPHEQVGYPYDSQATY